MAKKKQDYAKLYLIGEVTENMLSQFCRDFDNILARGASAIVVEISSYGGDLHIALAIYNRLKASPVPILTLASGFCSSSAVLIFSAGHKKLSRPHTWFLIHSISTEVAGGTGKIRAEFHQMAREHDEYAEIVAAASKIDRAQVLKLMDSESYMNANEAKEMGLVDDIQPID